MAIKIGAEGQSSKNIHTIRLSTQKEGGAKVKALFINDSEYDLPENQKLCFLGSSAIYTYFTIDGQSIYDKKQRSKILTFKYKFKNEEGKTSNYINNAENLNLDNIASPVFYNDTLTLSNFNKPSINGFSISKIIIKQSDFDSVLISEEEYVYKSSLVIDIKIKGVTTEIFIVGSKVTETSSLYDIRDEYITANGGKWSSGQTVPTVSVNRISRYGFTTTFSLSVGRLAKTDAKDPIAKIPEHFRPAQSVIIKNVPIQYASNVTGPITWADVTISTSGNISLNKTINGSQSTTSGGKWASSTSYTNYSINLRNISWNNTI